MILVIIGLVANSFVITKSMIVDFLPLFTEGGWEFLTTPGTSAYHPLWSLLIVFEIVGNLSLLALAVIALVLLFSRSHRAPKLMIVYFGSQAIFVVADFFLGDMIPTIAAEPDDESVKDIVRVLVATAIWVPYFCVSKRIKATFVS